MTGSAPPSLFGVTGRTALVTGSSRGIGKAILLGLAKAGADVAVHFATNRCAAEQVAHAAATFGVRSVTVQADLANPEEPERLVKQVLCGLGKIDILVLNASIQARGPWQRVDRTEGGQEIAANLWATVELIQYIVPGMIERNWGRILAIGSVQQVRPHPQMLIYAAMKSAQANLVRNLARQLAPHGITVNNLAPGVIATDRNADVLAVPAYHRQVVSTIPVGRVGEPEECAGAALLLCSDAGRYITGIDLPVDGGMHLP